MNDGLIDAIRHDAWATSELLAICRALSDRQLESAAPGTYGSIIETLRHIALAESRYCSRLTGQDTPFDARASGTPTFAEVAEHFDELASRWEKFLEVTFDGERIRVVKWPDGSDYDVPAAVHMAQSLHHGNEHRAHICTILTSIGITAPALGVWDYALATHRVKPSHT